MVDLKSIVVGIVLMLKKYTCINITIYAETNETNEEDYVIGIFALPLIGFAIGFAALFISSFKLIYDGFFVSTLILIFYVIITKLTNLKDTYRTLNYYIKPKGQTEQLSGVVGIVLIILMYFSLFRIVPSTAIAVMFIAGYSNLIILSAVIKRDKDNTSIIKYCTKYHIIAAFFISFLIAAILNYKLVISMSITYMISVMTVSLLDEKIEVLPSSAEGFIIETSQVLFLIITYLMKL